MSSRMAFLAAGLALSISAGCGLHGQVPWDRSAPKPAPNQAGPQAPQISEANPDQTGQVPIGSFRIQGNKLVKSADQTLGQEAPLANWRVELYQLVPGQSVDWNNPYQVTTTDSAGNFTFDGLPAGNYLVTSDLQQNDTAYDQNALTGPPEAQALNINQLAPYVTTPPPASLEMQGFEVSVGTQACECGLTFTEAPPMPHGIAGGGPCPTPTPCPTGDPSTDN